MHVLFIHPNFAGQDTFFTQDSATDYLDGGADSDTATSDIGDFKINFP